MRLGQQKKMLLHLLRQMIGQISTRATQLASYKSKLTVDHSVRTVKLNMADMQSSRHDDTTLSTRSHTCVRLMSGEIFSSHLHLAVSTLDGKTTTNVEMRSHIFGLDIIFWAVRASLRTMIARELVGRQFMSSHLLSAVWTIH
jgi:hypothetical protein